MRAGNNTLDSTGRRRRDDMRAISRTLIQRALISIKDFLSTIKVNKNFLISRTGVVVVDCRVLIEAQCMVPMLKQRLLGRPREDQPRRLDDDDELAPDDDAADELHSTSDLARRSRSRLRSWTLRTLRARRPQ